MEPKKISFGFSKTTKKSVINTIQKPDKVELIDCLEGQSIRVIGKEEVQPKGPLIIPLQNDRKITERLKNLVDICKQRDTHEDESEDKEIDISNNSERNKDETLDQRAARELLEQIKDDQALSNETKVFTLPLKPEDLPLDGAKESSLDDYNSVPINDFGLAMLRGMGWKDEKKKKIDKLDGPILRPKGMGLGADKMAKPSEPLIQPALDEVLEIRKNAYIKILAGKHKDAYGQIEGFDDDSGRVIIKLALGTTRLSLNEFMVQAVSKNEYAKYAKIINSARYEEYKNRDGSQVTNDGEIFVKKEIKNEINFQNSSDVINTDVKEDNVKVKLENSMKKMKYDDDNADTNDNSCKEKTSRKVDIDVNRNSGKSNYLNSSPKRSQWSGSKKKKSSHKRSSHKSHNNDRSRSRDNRYYSSRSDNEEDDKRHKKKTKKSKKPRSRSRNR